jgi:hypothetical protein
MAIELRMDTKGVGKVVVACVHCGEDVDAPGEGLAVWMPGTEPDPVTGTVFLVDFAHLGCVERFLEKHSVPAASATEIYIPLAELFDVLRRPLETTHEEQNDAEA